MIIPETRVRELQNYQDLLFVKSYKENTWRYLTYDDVVKLEHTRLLEVEDVKRIAKSL